MLLLSKPAATGSTITHVQSGFGQMPTSSTTAYTTLAAVGAGDLIVGMVIWQGSVQPTSITDDKGNSYTAIDFASGTYSTLTFWRGNITNGPTVITATWAAAAAYPYVVASEYTNARSLDGHSAQAFPFSPGGGTDALTSGNFTTTIAGDVIWGMSFNPSDATSTIAGTGFTQRVVDPGNWCVVGEDKPQSSAGTVAATFTAGVSTHSYGISGVALSTGPPPIAHVQGMVGASGPSSGVTTVTATFSAAVGSGNAVVGVAICLGSQVLSGVTDDKGNTYTIIDNASGAHAFSTFWRGNITNGPTTITATFTASTGYPQIIMDEYSGVVSMDGHKALYAGTVSGTDGLSTGNFTTTKNGDVIWGAAYNAAGTTNISSGTGFTQREQDPVSGNWSLVSEDKTQTTAGSVAVTFTPGGSMTAGVVGVALANS